MYYLFFFFHTFINAEATPTLSIPNGDLIFLYPNLSTSSPLDNAILSTGNATLNWMRQHNIEISSDVISLHVAVSYIKSPNERFFIQAVPPSVVMTPEKEFLLQIAPSTQLFHGSLPFNRTERQKALKVAMKQIGKPYAIDFQKPPNQFYCSSLVEYIYQPFTFIHDVFHLLFVPQSFWKQYYASLNESVPNTTGSNPTLLMHSPIVNLTKISPK